MSELRVDDVVIVDWSAAASPKRGRDSIWIAHVATGETFELKAIENLATRTAALQWLRQQLATLSNMGRHVVCGFDFSFGYPAGYANLLQRAFSKGDRERTRFEQVLSITASLISDAPTNANNRFAVANMINARTRTALFWGHPRTQSFPSLSPTKTAPPGLERNELRDFRHTERDLRVKSNWQLLGAGAVGSQVLMGLPLLEALRRSERSATLWPFEPHHLHEQGGTVVLAEVWPSMFATGEQTHVIRDAWQVATTAQFLGRLSPTKWVELFAPPSWATFTPQELEEIVGEEGWILGKP